ncbi:MULTISPECIES: ABC transporter permease [unclassified Gordonia (in: high G+C Gram-positive bacteria)]|uniref:ABC transporter permease n=1 Tax=unclassified Gordonia (in: high G+C Gram-positive bacteria) TaxID=2657482 RepID=UPI001FFF25DB|nr:MULTISPECIES: ABC transporter permease [unclassified Gordonia (in: high G+C Gram-positive bacteria)]UQE74425.1 ABC transporter permease [Gordonia sp. PP30]
MSVLANAPVLDQQASALPERSVRAWWWQTRVLIGRQLLVAFRDPATLIQVLVFPALTMLMFKVVLGDVVSKATGTDSVYGTVPLILLTSTMFGSGVSAIRVVIERSTGLLSRLYVLPINRGADFSARVLAETVRALATSIALVAAGFLIGFRFTQGIGPALGLFGVAMLYATAFAMVTLAVAVISRPGLPLVAYIGLLTTLMMFFNSGFAPVDGYPGWLQPIVANQPMSPAIELMRSLAAGGPITENLIKVIIWAFVALALTTYPAMRGYRKAAANA